MGKENLVVFTDGSCSRNVKVGAIGGIGIHFPDKELTDVSKIFEKGGCTNQRTELYAILQALKYINARLGLSKYRVFVKTDSMYSINCITNWVDNWIINGWKTKTGTQVANRELIEEIHKYYKKYTIIFEHIEAHNNLTDYDSIGNEIADSLANKATKKAISRSLSKYPKKIYKTDGSRLSKSPSYQHNGSKSARKTPVRDRKIATKNYPNEIIVELISANK